MNYKKIYDDLVVKCKERVLEGYYMEKHHIVPKCMGGTNEIDNLVLMTPEEHFIAHQLLVKIYPNVSGLIYACVRMTHHNTLKRINNKMYGWLKKRKAEIVSKQMRSVWEEKRPEIVKKMKAYLQSDEGKIQRSLSSKRVWDNASESRRQQVKDLQKTYNADTAKRNKELWQIPEYKEKMSKRKVRGSDGSKLKEKWADPVWRQKMLDSRKKNKNETN